MVPNSLGPGELLMHYGTQAQKDFWLPGLANGKEVPCFALTGPEAGSDAGAIPDKGSSARGCTRVKRCWVFASTGTSATSPWPPRHRARLGVQTL